MLARDDLAPFEGVGIKSLDMVGRAMVHRISESEIEIAIEQSAVPADTYLMAAH
jgi:hypothetical protein